MATVLNEHAQYVDANGRPLVGGRIYIGNVDADPVANPKNIFSDRALTVALANPQTLDANGRATNKIWVDGNYSLQVRDINDVQVFQDLDRGSASSEIGSTALSNIIGGDVITANAASTITSYIDKQVYVFTVAQINTGPVTIDIDGLGAKAVVKNEQEPIEAGDFVVGVNVGVIYNSTNDNFTATRYILDIGTFGKEVLASNDIVAFGNEVLAAVGPDAIRAASGLTDDVGRVDYFAMSTPPTNYIKANFAAVSRTDFDDLFAKIGTTFGPGDGFTTFNVPEGRAEFIRGLDDGRGVNPGRALGSFEGEAIQSHQHGGVLAGSTSFNTGGGGTPIQRFVEGGSTSFAGGPETRPRSIALLACIKYRAG